MMTQEFVEIDAHGNEIDWIDPVLDIAEENDRWLVDNGQVYEVPKQPGHQYVVREMDQS